MVILGISIILFTISAPIIAICIEAAKESTIRKRLEQEYQPKLAHLEDELAAKDAIIANLENKVADYEKREMSFDSRVQWVSECERAVEEKERNLERREQELEQRTQALYRDNEIIIARKVEEGIKGREKGLTADWRNFFRESSRFKEDKAKMYERAVLIADHLGVPLKCILTGSEKKLVDQLANELTEERYALMDLVMSCPEYRAKHLLEWMQQSPQNLQR